MTQFLSFQAQSASAGFFSAASSGAPLGNGGNGAVALGASATSSTALNSLADDAPSFANLLNAETAEVAPVVANQRGLAALLNNADVQSADRSFLTESNQGAVLDITTSANSILFNGEQAQIDEGVAFDNAQAGTQEGVAFDNAQAGTQETDRETDAVELGDQALLFDVVPLGVGAVSQAITPALSSADPRNIQPLDTQSLNTPPPQSGDVDLDDTEITLPPTSANASNLDGGLFNVSTAGSADSPDFNSPATSSPIGTTPPVTTFAQDADLTINTGIVTPADANTINLNGDALNNSSLLGAADLPDISVSPQSNSGGSPFTGGNATSNVSANILATTPDLLASPLPFAASDSGLNGEPTELNFPQTRTDTSAQNGLQLAGNNQSGIDLFGQTNIENAQPASNPARAIEQSVSQINLEQADGAPLRPDQNISRQAPSSLSVPVQSEAALINQNQGTGANVALAHATLPNAAQANLTQINLNTASAEQIDQQASIGQENQRIDQQASIGQENQRVDPAPNSFPNVRGPADTLSNISQIVQLLGQSGGAEAQSLALQTIAPSATQTGLNGQIANYTPQTTAQLIPAAFADETLPALSAQLSRGLVGGRDSFNIQLNPSELGRVDVRFFNNDDGSVNARVLVERVETLDLFQRDLRALERSLLQSGIKLSQEGIDLSLKDNGANDGGNNAASNGDFTGNEDQRNSENTQRLEDEGSRALSERLLVDDIGANVPSDVIQTIYARFTPGQLNIKV